jgi:hypothetical protein
MQLTTLVATGERLALPKAVQVPKASRDFAKVGDDEIARDEPHTPADHRPERSGFRAGGRSVVAVPRERLERLDHVAVRLRKGVRPRERTGPRDLVHHLALARARDFDRVEVLSDLVVVAREQLQPLDGVVDLLEELALLRLRGSREGSFPPVQGRQESPTVRRRLTLRASRPPGRP